MHPIVRPLLLAGLTTSVAMLAGAMSINALSAWVSLPDHSFTMGMRQVLIQLGTSALSGWTLPLVALTGVITAAFLVVEGQSGSLRINTQKLMNVVLVLYGVTVFVPLLRPAMLTGTLIGLLLVSPRPQYKIYGIRWFSTIVFAFIVIFAIGMLRGWVDVDQVRARITVGDQINGFLPIIHAAAVYFVIKRNKWGVREFEIYFLVFLALGVAISIESLVTFYAKIGSHVALFGSDPLNASGMFQSAWVANFHIVARVGMILIFGALYFYTKTRSGKYLLILPLGSILLFSALSRQSLIATGLGLVIFFLLVRKSQGGRRQSARMLNWVVLPALITGALLATLVFVGLATEIRNDPFGINVLTARPVMLVRGLDAFLYTDGIGTGPALLPHYTASSVVPTPASDVLLPWIGVDFRDAIDILTRTGRLEREAAGFTAHNFWFTLIYEWGLLGLAVVIFLAYRGWRLIHIALKADKARLTVRSTSAMWAVFSMVIAISFSALFTSKFAILDFYVVMFLFLGAVVRETACHRWRRTV